MGRLKTELPARVESFCDRVVAVAGAMEGRGISRRIVDQVMAAGTSVGANMFEADEVVSRADFVKCVSISAKELSETRFWLRLFGRNSWVDPDRLGPLLLEADELRKILGTIIARSKAEARPSN